MVRATPCAPAHASVHTDTDTNVQPHTEGKKLKQESKQKQKLVDVVHAFNPSRSFCELDASLVYIWSSRPGGAWRDPVSNEYIPNYLKRKT